MKGVEVAADDGEIQTSLRLPKALHDRLRAASGERGLGQEVRRRLEASFELESDPATSGLVSLVVMLARELKRFTGTEWSANPFAHQTFKLALPFLLGNAPKGKAVLPEKWEEVSPYSAMFSPQTTPEQAAQLFAFAVLSAKGAGEEDW